MKSPGDLLSELPPEIQEKAKQALEEGATLEEVVEKLAPAVFRGDGVISDRLEQAALAERLQFDEDVPELRTGPLPPGVKPAVPVKTEVRDSVSLGWLLEKASNDLLEKIEASRLLVKPSGNSLIPREPEDPPSYQRGKVPASVEKELPPGFGLQRLDDERRRRLTWKFISTTQGRRSVVPVIEEKVAERLSRKLGVPVEIGELGYEPDHKHTWSLDISGPESVNPSFAVIDTAIGALSAGLVRQLSDQKLSCLLLEIKPVGLYSARKVGWVAGVWSNHTEQ